MSSRTRLARPVGAPGLVVLTLFIALSVTLVAPGPIAAAPTKDNRLGVTPAASPRNGERAVQLLRRVARADSTVTYAGLQFVSAWSPTGTASTLVEVHNVAGEGTALRVRGSAAGPAAAMFTTASTDGVDASLWGAPADLLDKNYRLRYAGSANATGRRAHVVDMFGARGVLAARFWIDRESGLLLRRELYDDSGRTVRASAFAQLRVGPRAVPSHLPPISQPMVAQTLSKEQVTDLEHEGWACPATMAGYLSLYDTRRIETATGDVLHLSYSDGLSTVSVFQQAGSIGTDGLEGYEPVESADGLRFVRAGIPQQVIWSADGVVYAVVADAPPDVVEQVMADLPRPDAPRDGMLDRLGRGLDRVGSWVNPFA